MLANGLVHVQFFAVLPVMLQAAGYQTWAYGTATAVSAAIVVGLELVLTRYTQRWPTWIAVIAGWTLLVVGRSAYGLPGGYTIIIVATVLAAIGQIIGGPAAFAYPAKAAPPGAMGRYIASAHASFNLGYIIGPIAGVLLWTEIGDAFWAICLAFGVLMIFPAIWGMRPTGPALTGPAPTGPAMPAEPGTSADDKPAEEQTDKATSPSPT
jgi:MFS family permease